MTVSPVAELSICADTGEVRYASAWLATVCLAHSVPSGLIGRLDICLNEVLANVIAHGGAAALMVPIHLQFEMQRSQGSCMATVMVSDAGIAFDPRAVLQKPKPEPKSLSEVEPGGLGLVLIRSNADNLVYRRSEGLNRFSFSVYWTEE